MISVLFEVGWKTTKNFKVETFREPNKKDTVKEDGHNKYRRIKTKSGHFLTFAITKKAGPKKGHTKLIDIGHPKNESN